MSHPHHTHLWAHPQARREGLNPKSCPSRGRLTRPYLHEWRGAWISCSPSREAPVKRSPSRHSRGFARSFRAAQPASLPFPLPLLPRPLTAMAPKPVFGRRLQVREQPAWRARTGPAPGVPLPASSLFSCPSVPRPPLFRPPHPRARRRDASTRCAVGGGRRNGAAGGGRGPPAARLSLRRRRPHPSPSGGPHPSPHRPGARRREMGECSCQCGQAGKRGPRGAGGQG